MSEINSNNSGTAAEQNQALMHKIPYIFALLAAVMVGWYCISSALDVINHKNEAEAHFQSIANELKISAKRSAAHKFVVEKYLDCVYLNFSNNDECLVQISTLSKIKGDDFAGDVSKAIVELGLVEKHK